MNGKEDEFAHGGNATTTASNCKTARGGRIRHTTRRCRPGSRRRGAFAIVRLCPPSQRPIARVWSISPGLGCNLQMDTSICTKLPGIPIRQPRESKQALPPDEPSRLSGIDTTLVCKRCRNSNLTILVPVACPPRIAQLERHSLSPEHGQISDSFWLSLQNVYMSMPPMLPMSCPACELSFGDSATIAAVVRIRPATDAAFCSA